MPCQRRIQSVTYKCRLSAAAHTRNSGNHPKRELHRNILQVVLHGAAHLHSILPLPLLIGNIHLSYSRQIINCQRAAGGTFSILALLKSLLDSLLNRTLIHNLSTVHTCIRTNINKLVCRADDLLIMLHNQDRISQIPQILDYRNQLPGILVMETYARLIQNV